MALRRNTTGMQALADSGFPMPVGLEHKILATTTTTPAGNQGGGLLPGTWLPWINECMTAGAIRTAIDCLSPPTSSNLDGSWSNFWGEVIGAVTLYQGMYDVAAAMPGGLAFAPLQPSSGFGGALAAFFQAWRAGPTTTPSALPSAAWNLGMDGVVLACSCEWEAAAPGSQHPNLTPLVIPTMGGLLSAVGGQGQNWDCSIHQMSRAVQSLHHVGYTFDWGERILILSRLHFWRAVACQDIDTLIARLLAAEGKGGVDPYGPAGLPPVFGPAPTNTTCGTSMHRAPTLDQTLEGVLSMVLSGCLVPPGGGVLGIFYGWALSIARDYARSIAVHYRETSPPGLGIPGHRWRTVDELAVPVGDTASETVDSLRGTFNAIVSLFLLDRAGGFWGCTNRPTLPAGAQQSLSSFFSIFCSSPLATIPRPAWGGGYVGG